MYGQTRPQVVARVVDGLWVGGCHRQREITFGRQGQQQRLERRVGRLVAERAAHGVGEPFLRDLVRGALRPLEDQVLCKVLARFPAVEQVRIGREQDVAVLLR